MREVLPSTAAFAFHFCLKAFLLMSLRHASCLLSCNAEMSCHFTLELGSAQRCAPVVPPPPPPPAPPPPPRSIQLAGMRTFRSLRTAP